MKMIMDLQLFAGGHNVTVLKDAHMTTASASSTSDVQAAATVTLTLTPASNYEVADVQVLAGGVTVHQDDDTISFAMGSSDVVIYVTSQKNNEYRISENVPVVLNGVVNNTVKRNLKEIRGTNGELLRVDCTPTALSISADIIKALEAEGVIEKYHPAWKGTPTPSA